MKNQRFVSSLSTVLAIIVAGSGVGAQTSEPPSAPPGSVPIEPERREPEPPPAPAPRNGSPRAPPERPPAGRVEFVPNDPSVSLLTQTGVAPVAYGAYDYGWWGYGAYRVFPGFAPVFTTVCRGPCTASMEPGTYELALEKGGRVARVAPTYIPGNAKLRGDYVDRSGTRTTGAVIGVAGSIAGIVMMIASSHREVDCDPSGVCVDHHTVNDGLFIGGLGALLGSIITASILMSVSDRAEVTVTPLRLSTPGFMGVGYDRGVTQGAALSLKF